ncbi:MAG: class I SAM-dependent methyltransferase [Sulfurimonas sp.]|uniref:class I SAM-dependent methyltransferase n=1 Tax=Sulfurimonas sp. TaxID=2022749 RepID=UPI002637EA0E|nr:class I SAM-dependent methyltransferase [Sulfurimonas sp.]MDD5401288.1 class I SAM-dependent methyltransferase [Sulfurimonas sp.]
MNKYEYDFPKKGINKYTTQYIRNLPDLTGKIVLDIPCGDGRASYEFKKKGAEVKAFDLFPDFMKLTDIESKYADLSEELPIESESVDYIICQEGIEHIPNQLKVLQEFNRVLKKDAILLITTPNDSQIKVRMSNFLLETDLWKRMPPTEVDSIWFAENDTNKLYYGHLFLLGAQHFQTLLTLSGFKTKKRIKTDFSTSSLILGVVFYPVLAVMTFLAYFLYKDENKHVEEKARKRILFDRAILNLLPTTLFNKHIFWEIKKESNNIETISKLRQMYRT